MRSLHLLYHELRPEKTSYSYVTTCEDFEAHCSLYAQIRRSAGEEFLLPEITFDDGHRSDLTLALPALQRHGLRATFFVTAGWTGERAGYMAGHDLRSLRDAGYRVGAHGMTHKLLTGCTDAELDEELGGARRRLEDALGGEVRAMSLPGGRSNTRVLRACRAAGYRQVFTSVPRAEVMDSSPCVIGRLNLRGGTTVAWLRGVLQPATGALTALERADRVKSLAKRAMGDRAYARLWAFVNRQEPETADAGATGL